MNKMDEKGLNEFTTMTEEKSLWLKTVAKTCLAHKKYLEQLPLDKISPDDSGLAELSNAVLFMYGVLLKHNIVKDVPENPSIPTDTVH